jgi:hypothetical protein
MWHILPVVILSAIHSLLSCLQRFCQATSKSARCRSVLTRWCCCAAVAISITAVPRRRVERGFPPDRTFCRRCRRCGFCPCRAICTRRRSRSSRSGRWRWARGSRRRRRWRLFHLFKICSGGPARGRVVKALSKPPSCDIISFGRSRILGCSAYRCFLAV